MAALIEYKCPCCGGGIAFDPNAQKLKCPYCDTEFDMQTLQQQDEALNQFKPEDMHWENEAGLQWEPGEEASVRIYSCRSCGGQIVADVNTGATTCPYCDNPVVMAPSFAGVLRPNCVIPFKLDKQAAKDALNRHLQGKWLLPRAFRDQNHIDEVKGIYVPFWLFNADSDADIHYNATRVRRWSDSRYEYTETQYYSVLRSGRLSFDNVPVDGSSKMPDDLMESLEPFHMDEAVDFQTAYLAGYLADKYDVTAQDSEERANSRIKRSTEDAFRSTVLGYATVIPVSSNVRLENGKTRYALLPVWILNTTWNGNRYLFAMNGQTGKFVGNLPMDKGAFARWFCGIAAGVAAAAFAVMSLFGIV